MPGKKFSELNNATEVHNSDLLAVSQDKGGGVLETRKLTAAIFSNWIKSLLGTASALDVPAGQTAFGTASALMVGNGDSQIRTNAGSSSNPIVLTSADDVDDLPHGWYTWDNSSVPQNAPRQTGTIHQFPANANPASRAQNYYNAGATSSTDIVLYRGGGTAGWNGWLDMRPLGVGQTWQDVTASRAFSADYPNTTGRPIAMQVVLRIPASSTATTNVARIDIDGVEHVRGRLTTFAGQNSDLPLNAIIPAGAAARVTATSETEIYLWRELRT